MSFSPSSKVELESLDFSLVITLLDFHDGMFMAFYALTPNHGGSVLQSDVSMIEEISRSGRRELSQREGSPPSLIREPPDRNMVPVVTSAAACKHFSEVDLTDTH